MRIVQINELTIHPLADLLPQMPENEYLHFRDDIKARGLKEDIWVLNGQVVDGRHRYRARRELGIEPTFRELPPETDEQAIVGLVLSLNVWRHHLDQSQRSMIAARLETYLWLLKTSNAPKSLEF